METAFPLFAQAANTPIQAWGCIRNGMKCCIAATIKYEFQRGIQQLIEKQKADLAPLGTWWAQAAAEQGFMITVRDLGIDTSS